MAYVKKSEREDALAEKVKPAETENMIVKNTSKNPTWVTATKRCGVGESVIVSGAEFQASRKSIENAVKHGLLEVVE